VKKIVKIKIVASCEDVSDKRRSVVLYTSHADTLRTLCITIALLGCEGSVGWA
jgi:hypothetical protein